MLVLSTFPYSNQLKTMYLGPSNEASRYFIGAQNAFITKKSFQTDYYNCSFSSQSVGLLGFFSGREYFHLLMIIARCCWRAAVSAFTDFWTGNASCFIIFVHTYVCIYAYCKSVNVKMWFDDVLKLKHF